MRAAQSSALTESELRARDDDLVVVRREVPRHCSANSGQDLTNDRTRITEPRSLSDRRFRSERRRSQGQKQDGKGSALFGHVTPPESLSGTVELEERPSDKGVIAAVVSLLCAHPRTPRVQDDAHCAATWCFRNGLRHAVDGDRTGKGRGRRETFPGDEEVTNSAGLRGEPRSALRSIVVPSRGPRSHVA